MKRPHAQTSVHLPATWEIYPQLGYDGHYLNKFGEIKGSKCGPCAQAPDGGSVFIVSGVSDEDVSEVMKALKDL
jgi:hypothetical protein